jgi:hypothetical protein
MNTGIYISLRDDETFHTIIIKKVIKEFTYIAAIGYAGGQVYGEFYAKLSYDDNHNITGLFSNSTGSGLWDYKLIALKFNSDRELFDTETEYLEEFMNSEDEKIQWDLIKEYRKYIYYGYDEETDAEYEYPEAKPIDTSIFTEFENSPGKYYNDKWGDEWLEITNSDIWGLSISFPHLIDNYL